MESPSKPSDDPGLRHHPRVRRGRSPPSANPSGHFSDVPEVSHPFLFEKGVGREGKGTVKTCRACAKNGYLGVQFTHKHRQECKSVRLPKWRSRSRRTSAQRVFLLVLVYVSERGMIFSDYFLLLPHSVLGLVN